MIIYFSVPFITYIFICLLFLLAVLIEIYLFCFLWWFFNTIGFSIAICLLMWKPASLAVSTSSLFKKITNSLFVWPLKSFSALIWIISITLIWITSFARAFKFFLFFQQHPLQNYHQTIFQFNFVISTIELFYIYLIWIYILKILQLLILHIIYFLFVLHHNNHQCNF